MSIEPVQIGDATLYCGDCLSVMPTLGEVDGIITDAPYEKEAHRSDRRVQRRDGLVAGPLSFAKITDDMRQFLPTWAKYNCNGWLIVFCQAEGVALWRDQIEAAAIKYKAPMIWVKPDGMPQFNGQGPGIGYESMVVAWCSNGYSRWNGGGRHGVFIIPKGSDTERYHETQKPLRLMQELVKLFSNDSETILDPFMGSGSTGVACAKLGRKFIGIEIDPNYFDIACKRIEEAYAQPDLFIEPPKKLVQDSLL